MVRVGVTHIIDVEHTSIDNMHNDYEYSPQRNYEDVASNILTTIYQKLIPKSYRLLIVQPLACHNIVILGAVDGHLWHKVNYFEKVNWYAN